MSPSLTFKQVFFLPSSAPAPTPGHCLSGSLILHFKLPGKSCGHSLSLGSDLPSQVICQDLLVVKTFDYNEIGHVNGRSFCFITLQNESETQEVMKISWLYHQKLLFKVPNYFAFSVKFKIISMWLLFDVILINAVAIPSGFFSSKVLTSQS